MEEAGIKKGSLISRGGSSWVYHGMWNAIPVAIKEINPDDPNSKIKNSDKFIAEKTILAILGSHPSIIQLFLAIDNPRCLILEVGEIELRRRLFPVFSMAKLEWEIRMQFAVQIAEGVIYFQRKNIIHLDLNPENVVIMADGKTVKIIDFERAVQLNHPQDIYKSRFTFGTPGYVAPEAIDGIYGFKSDVWSFGVILWVLVTYKDARKEQRDGQWDFSPPAEFPECTPKQITFMQSFWQKEPKERPAMDDALTTEMKSQFNIPETKEPVQESSDRGSEPRKGCSVC